MGTNKSEQDQLFQMVKDGLITLETVDKANKYDRGELGAKTFAVTVGHETFAVTVSDEGTVPVVTEAALKTTAAPDVKPTPRPAAPPASKPAPVQAMEGQSTVVAPMPGTLLKYFVRVGDAISAGDPIVVLEAMKMENTIPSPAAGVIQSLGPDAGQNVVKGEVLAVLG